MVRWLQVCTHSLQCRKSKLALNTSCRPRTFSSNANLLRKYVPRRSLMYVPGHDIKKLQKIPQIGMDCAVLECEDGVSQNKKVEARENIRMMLEELDGSVAGIDIAVRINSVKSGLFEYDLHVIMNTEHRPNTILLPKTDTIDDIQLFTDCLQAIVGSNSSRYCPHLITYVESAEGLLNMKHVLLMAEQFTKKGIYHLDGVVFGSDDYCADIGALRTTDAAELVYARQKIVAVAKAFRIQAIDMVCIEYQDTDQLRLQSKEGARTGFSGKQVIHPVQVPIVNAAFTPCPERVEWANALIESFEEHQMIGQGAFTFCGNMIDRPLLLQAQHILQTMSNIRQRDAGHNTADRC